MKHKIAIVFICFFAAVGVSFADVIVGEFDILNGVPSLTPGGQVVFSLNANGTIAASLGSYLGNIEGFGFDSIAWNLPESNFSPTIPDNAYGWGTIYGDFRSGFLCTNCGTNETWTIGNIGDYTSVWEVLGGGNAAPYSFFLLDDSYGQWAATASAIPEPTSLILLGTGLGILWLGVNRRRKK